MTAFTEVTQADPTDDDMAGLVKKLADALRSLLDEQNGPPLIRRKDQWQSAVDCAKKVLAKAEGEVMP